MDERKYCTIENELDHSGFGNFSQLSVELNNLQFNGSQLKYIYLILQIETSKCMILVIFLMPFML